METIFDDWLGASDDVWPAQTGSEQQRWARKLVPSLRVAARTGEWSRGPCLLGMRPCRCVQERAWLVRGIPLRGHIHRASPMEPVRPCAGARASAALLGWSIASVLTAPRALRPSHSGRNASRDRL